MIYRIIDVWILADAVLGSSPAVLFPALCVSRRIRAAALEVLVRRLRGSVGEPITVDWLLAAAFDDSTTARGALLPASRPVQDATRTLHGARRAWTRANLPPWRVLRQKRLEFSVWEWTNLKEHVLRATQAAVMLPSAVLGPAVRAEVRHDVGELVRLHVALHSITQSISEQLSGRICLQDIGPPTARATLKLWLMFHADRAQLPDAIKDQGRRASDFLDRRLGRALRDAMRQDSAGDMIKSSWTMSSAGNFARNLEAVVDKSLAKAGGRFGTQSCVIKAACTVIQDKMMTLFRESQSAGAENDLADLPDLPDASPEAEQGLLVRMLGLETHALQHDSALAQSLVDERICAAQQFLEGPNGSGAYRATFDHFCALLWRERALREDGELVLREQSTGAADAVEARGAMPWPLGSFVRRAPAAGAAAGTGISLRNTLVLGVAASRPGTHSCSESCIAAGSSAARSLLAALKHLCVHSGGTGVSGYPEAGSNLLTRWMATVDGPCATPWEGRQVTCTLTFCPTVIGGLWPTKPPQLRVIGPIPFHPNIDPRSGLVCMDLLGDRWSCAGGVLAILLSFRSLLASPTTSDAATMPANCLAAHSFLQKPLDYEVKNRRIALDMPRI